MTGTILTILFVVLLLFYAFIHGALLVGLRRLNHAPSLMQPFVSVIVAARNEEQHIGRLLEALVHQNYPSYEIIIANDRSTDMTGSIIASVQDRHAKVHRVDIHEVPHGVPAKKNALNEAIKMSRGEILCFTDADCLPGPQWIASLLSAFEDGVGMVVGRSPYEVGLLGDTGGTSQRSTLLWKFIDFEETKSALWSAGSIGWNRGWLCAGRNLAYRRDVFDQVGGFEAINKSISGDDDLFLQTVRERTRWNIRYVNSPESIVPTAPPSNFGSFVNQRKRHFSAGKFYRPSVQAVLFVYHFTNLATVVALAASLYAGGSFQLGVYATVAKLAVDYATDSLAADQFGQKSSGVKLWYLELLFVLYNSIIGPLGFLTSFEWKPTHTPT